MLLHRLPAADDVRFNDEFRRRALADIKKLRENHKLRDKIKDVIVLEQSKGPAPLVEENPIHDREHFYSRVINAPKIKPKVERVVEDAGQPTKTISFN